MDDLIETAARKDAWATGTLLLPGGTRDMAFDYSTAESAIAAKKRVDQIVGITTCFIREARTRG
jgi:hypothetical protein